MMVYSRQKIDNSDIEAVVEALRSDMLTCGERVVEFERGLCELTGAKFAVENKTELSQNEQNEIAQVLASQIGEGLGRAFSTSALKDVLKDININISISFEGR